MRARAGSRHIDPADISSDRQPCGVERAVLRIHRPSAESSRPEDRSGRGTYTGPDADWKRRVSGSRAGRAVLAR